MTTEIEVDTKLTALAKSLEVEADELTDRGFDHYGLTVYALGSKEYAIGSDDEANEASAQNVKDSLWAFKSEFIVSECGLPYELAEVLAAFQSDKCEGANDAIEALIEKTCGIESFVDSAVSADGRGHFLNGYDGDENECDGFYIYRIN